MNKQSELRKMRYLTLRNIKLYFKDKMTFLISLITPLILLVLFIAFLKSTYEDSILSIIQGFDLDQSLIDAFTGGWLFSSVLATSCITVAFCSGMMVIDKINRANIDFMVSPVKKKYTSIKLCVSKFIFYIYNYFCFTHSRANLSCLCWILYHFC